MEWVLLGVLVVAFTFYYSYRQRKETHRAEKRKTFEEAMSRQKPETIEVKDVVAEDPQGLEHTREGIAFLTLPLRAGAGDRPQAVIIFGKRAEELLPQVRRGTRIRATGRPTTRTLTDRQGNTTRKTELIASQIELIGRSR